MGAVAACGEPTAFEELPEQPPASTEDEQPGAEGPEPCSEELLEPETRWTGIGEDDGLYRIRLSSAEDVCGGFGWWAGWSVTVAFTDGRPVPGTYSLDDPDLDVRITHAVGKTQATPTLEPSGRLQVLEVSSDGSVDGVLCDVEITRDVLTDDDEPGTLTLDGRFTAGPC